MTNFIDTHTHLYDEAFAEDADAAIKRAIDAGVTKMVFPDIDSSSRKAMFELASRHEDTVFPCLGLHPTSVGAGWEQEYSDMLGEVSRHKIIAIGETGIDCYWSKEFIGQQKEVFRLQLEMASKMDLPVIIHSRESTEIIFDILEGFKGAGLRGVFHAFSGSYETFERFSAYGDWYVGIVGVLTYKKSSIAETIKRITLERILTETDSPYLTPVPHRGQRNESSYIPLIADKIAAQKGISIENVAETTYRNAQNLFRI